MMNFRTLLSYLLVLTILVYGLPVHSQSPESVEASQTQAVIDASYVPSDEKCYSGLSWWVCCGSNRMGVLLL